jgi:hypothetical protein
MQGITGWRYGLVFHLYGLTGFWEAHNGISCLAALLRLYTQINNLNWQFWERQQ